MTLDRRNYPELPSPAGPYVHAVKAGSLLFLSGITAFGSPQQGKPIDAQADAVFDQIETVARREGTNLSALVKVTIFITSFVDVARLRGALFRRYGAHLPASSLVQVAGLFSPDLNIEVEAVLALQA